MNIYKRLYQLSMLIALTVFTSCFSSKGITFKEKPKEAYQQKVENKIDHSAWDAILKQHVTKDGFVDYKALKADAQPLNDYVSFLSNTVPKKDWAFEEQLAYFINVYNANTIKLIVDNYPVESIKKIDATISPFLKKIVTVDGKKFSLADIEKGFLQKMKEPRVHFAINCASFSCPKLMRDAYTAENVDALMEKSAKEFVNSDKNTIAKDKAEISSIFNWYEKDFLNYSDSIIDFINQYSDVKIDADAVITYKDYDWSLNDIQK